MQRALNAQFSEEFYQIMQQLFNCISSLQYRTGPPSHPSFSTSNVCEQHQLSSKVICELISSLPLHVDTPVHLGCHRNYFNTFRRVTV